MFDIYEEIKILLIRKGLSMRRAAIKLREMGYTKIPKAGGLSNKFNKKTVRFSEVQLLLDYLGYEFVIRPKQKL
jgi:hypothetical protein